jgi:hypothetical protein
MQDGCARSGWASFRARRGPLAQTFGDVMKTPIKVVKRGDTKVSRDTKNFSARKSQQRAIEVIVKTWIMESSERRRANVGRFSCPRTP